MAFAYVNSDYYSNNSTSSASVTLTGVTAGNLLVSYLYGRDTPTVSGTPSGFTEIVASTGWSIAYAHYSTTHGGGSVTATYTLSNTKRLRMVLAEYSYDTANTLVLETDTHVGDQPMDDAGEPISTTNAAGIIISGVGYWGGSNMTDANSSSTRRETQNDNTSSFSFADYIVSSTTSYGYDWVQTGTKGCQFAFSEAAAGGGGIILPAHYNRQRMLA